MKNLQKQSSRGVLKKRFSENMQQIYRGTPMPKCDFNNAAKKLYWNRTSAWVFSCKFAAYFPNTFSWEHLWVAASESYIDKIWQILASFKAMNQQICCNIDGTLRFIGMQTKCFLMKMFTYLKYLYLSLRTSWSHSNHSSNGLFLSSSLTFSLKVTSATKLFFVIK